MTHIEDLLTHAIIEGYRKFDAGNPEYQAYGLAVVRNAVGTSFHVAIATEQGLEKIAASYDYGLSEDEKKTWLRWANPDDGWIRGSFDDFGKVII